MTTKETLISLAKEKGFLAKIANAPRIEELYKEGRASLDSRDIVYYLWMCELQKWLRDVYKIDIGMWHNEITDKWRLDYILKEYEDYESALEEALIKSLKLI